LIRSVSAVITAGGRITGEFASAAGTSVKALVPVEGSHLLQRVLDPVWDSNRITGPVIVVGPVEDLQAALNAPARDAAGRNVCLIPEGDSGPENIARGLSALAALSEHHWVLLCTCDVPFLTDDAIGWLLDNSPEDADIVFPILTKAEYEAEFPGSPGSYVEIEGNSYTGSSVFLIRPSAILQNRALIERVFQARKNTVAMARLGGIGLLWRLLAGTLTVEYVEARASQLTACRCTVVRHAPPSLAADIDTMEDYHYACGQLAALGARA
jgi:molybdopterin-guanine dinucleotide biosynthesis protein A